MLELSANPMTVKQIINRYDAGNMVFDHPVQRRENQWNLYQKSLFIHSIVEDFIIPTSVAIKGNVLNTKDSARNSYSFIDGQQRLTSTIAYMKGQFALHPDTPLFKKVSLPLDMFVEDFEENYDEESKERPELYNKKRLLVDDDGEFLGFDAKNLFVYQLPENIFFELITRSLPINMYESCITEDEAKEVFYRLNNGTPLTLIQRTKARLSIAMIEKIKHLMEHYLHSISNQRRKRFRVSTGNAVFVR